MMNFIYLIGIVLLVMILYITPLLGLIIVGVIYLSFQFERMD